MTTYCRRCKKTPSALTTYWGDPLCHPCAVAVAELLDAHDKWPPVPWTDEDEEMLSAPRKRRAS